MSAAGGLCYTAPVRLLALASLLLPALCAADYSQPGPLTWTTRVGQINVQGQNYAYDLYVPDGAGPFPVVAIVHGYSNGKENYAGYGKLLASRGALVVLPQFPIGLADYTRFTDVTLACLDEVVSQNAMGGGLQGKVDGSRQAVAGHSMGGLIALMTEVRRPTLKAAVLLDPVENSGFGAAILAQVTTPTLFLFAEPGTCNASRNAASWYPALTGTKGKLTVTGSTHCDAQEPINATCAFACPGSLQSRVALYQRYTIAWLQYFLACDPAARAEIDGSGLAQDKAASRVGEDAFAGMPSAACAVPGVDGGAGGGGGADGGSTDGGSTDAGSTEAGGSDAGSGGSDGGPQTGNPGAGGCGCAGAPAGTGALGLLLLLGARSRRKSR